MQTGRVQGCKMESEEL